MSPDFLRRVNVSASQPVILSATDGKILSALPLAGGSDAAAFNPATMEAFSTHGKGTMTIVKEKSPTSFEVEQNLKTMSGARTVTLDGKTGHLFTMSQERGPAPPPSLGGGRPPQGTPVPGSFTILMIGKQKPHSFEVNHFESQGGPAVPFWKQCVNSCYR